MSAGEAVGLIVVLFVLILISVACLGAGYELDEPYEQEEG